MCKPSSGRGCVRPDASCQITTHSKETESECTASNGRLAPRRQMHKKLAFRGQHAASEPKPVKKKRATSSLSDQLRIFDTFTDPAFPAVFQNTTSDPPESTTNEPIKELPEGDQCPNCLGSKEAHPPTRNPGTTIRTTTQIRSHACSDSTKTDKPRERQGSPSCSGAPSRLRARFPGEGCTRCAAQS